MLNITFGGCEFWYWRLTVNHGKYEQELTQSEASHSRIANARKTTHSTSSPLNCARCLVHLESVSRILHLDAACVCVWFCY